MLGMKYLLQPIRSNCFDFDALLNQQEQGSKIVIKVMAKLVMDMCPYHASLDQGTQIVSLGMIYILFCTFFAMFLEGAQNYSDWPKKSLLVKNLQFLFYSHETWSN